MKSLPLGRTTIINPSIREEKVAIKKPAKKPIAAENKTVHGLGDVVHRVANPIARVIDYVAKTNIQGCGGCSKRRESLNRKFPIT